MFMSMLLSFAAPANAAETVVFGHDTQITIAHRAFGVLEGGSTVGLAPVTVDGVYLLASDPVSSPSTDGVLGSGWLSVFSPLAGESVTILIDENSSLVDIAEGLELSGMGLTASVVPSVGGGRLVVSLDEDGDDFLAAVTMLGAVTPIDAPVLSAFGLYQDSGELHLQALNTLAIADWGRATYQGSGWIVPASIGTMNLTHTSWILFERAGYMFLGDTEWVWTDRADRLQFNETGWDAFDGVGPVY